MKIAALTTLLLCLAPSITFLGAGPACPAPESTGPAGSKPEARRFRTCTAVGRSGCEPRLKIYQMPQRTSTKKLSAQLINLKIL